MNASLNFDRAAGIYDSTREFPPLVASLGIHAIAEAAGPAAAILDVGTGTGRISVPLLQRGLNLTGCDISSKMMAVLREKVPDAQLAQADAARLPFPDRQFDAVTTCHVMHLVGPWREALREFRRVLKPAGVYINARTEWSGESRIGEDIDRFWERRVEAYGARWRRPGAQDKNELHNELRAMGASVTSTEAVRYPRLNSAAAVLGRIANRVDSQTWQVPEGIHLLAVRETREWAAQEYGNLEATFEEESAFILDIIRFDAAKRGRQ
jgi:ubiquinone/menaquinone biosynthesis C-methylase UbiE